MKRFGLTLQILSIAMVPILLIDSLLTYRHISSSIDQAELLLKSKGEIIVKQVATACEFDVLSGNDDRIRALLQQTVGNNEIVFAAVINDRGNTIAEITADNFDGDSLSSYMYYNHAVQTPELASSDIFSPNSEAQETSYRNIGLVHIYLSPLRFVQNKNRIYREAFIFFLSTLLVAVLLTMAISRRITRPVFILLDYLRKVESGQLGILIEHPENNEIGDVQNSFNSMSLALQSSRQQQDHKIKSATLDLMQTMDQLEKQNQEISIARDQAEQANKIKTQFLANISHEIRTPINGILGFARLLSHNKLPPQPKLYAQTIKESALDLIEIVNEVLDFSKIEADKLSINNQPFDLHELLESTRNSLLTSAMDKQIDLFLCIYSDTPQIIIGDSLRLKQILNNLIGNAIKFTEQGFVELRVFVEEQHGQQIRLSLQIRDSGIGISERDQASLFQAFNQVESDLNRRYSGTGLGLSIAKNLAELMGGDIQIKSKVGAGSLFTVELPFELTSDQPSKTLENSASCLILAFDPLAISEVQTMFQRIGYDTETIVLNKNRDPQAIETHIRQNLPHIDLLVVDLRGYVSEYLPSLDDDWLQQTRTIMMHYDQKQLPAEISPSYEFVSVINTSNTLLELINRAPDIAETTEQTRQFDHQLNPMSILVVDDNRINLTLATELLHLWGHHPYETDNAAQAMRLFKSKHFDLILLDIQMPEIDGVELMHMMRRQEPELTTPIVAVTANTLEGEKQRLLNSGFDDYLGKPLDENQFHNLLEGQSVDASTVASMQVNSDDPAPAIDLQLTQKLSANNDRLVAEVFELLKKELPLQRQQLQQAYQLDDADNIARCLHKLTGTTCYAGLPQLKKLLMQYDVVKVKSPQQAAGLVKDILDELERIDLKLQDCDRTQDDSRTTIATQ